MSRIPFLTAILLIALIAICSSQTTAIKAGKLIDPASGVVLTNQVILVEGQRIKAVGSNVAIPKGAAVIDLSRYTVLPGLIDGHTHILLQPEDEGEIPPIITKSQAFRTVQGVAAARAELEAGFTTLRDVDSEGAGFADIAIRDAINQGIIPGPRLFVSGDCLTITGGHMNLVGINPDIQVPEPGLLTDSRDAMIAAVRRNIKYGVDLVKIYATGRTSQNDPVTLEPLCTFSEEEIRLVVSEAKRWRKDVAAHAYGGQGAKNAILAGVRSIEHGMFLDDEMLKLMVERGTFWCPTLCVYIPEDEKTPVNDMIKRIIPRHKDTFQRAMKLGVKIAFGTDVGAYTHGHSAREFVKMVEYGMKPIDAIRSATITTSELVRMEKEIGTIEPGKYADIIATEGNPVDDIKALTRVVFVMKEGKVHKGLRD
ncbi:MAG: amidohydrolase family protein [Ignavibacteria bacterium]|nr:amidohydrolase family protein [Ignavibacteria bacterium]